MTAREKRADPKLEQAAREADRGTRAGSEIAASCAAFIAARRNP